MIGIETLKSAVSAVAEIGTVAGEVLEDGKIRILELPKLIRLASPVEALMALAMEETLAELQDLTGKEVEDLVSVFEQKFSLESDVAELAVEEGVEIALRWADLVVDTIKFGARLTRKDVA